MRGAFGCFFRAARARAEPRGGAASATRARRDTRNAEDVTLDAIVALARTLGFDQRFCQLQARAHALTGGPRQESHGQLRIETGQGALPRKKRRAVVIDLVEHQLDVA